MSTCKLNPPLIEESHRCKPVKLIGGIFQSVGKEKIGSVFFNYLIEGLFNPYKTEKLGKENMTKFFSFEPKGWTGALQPSCSVQVQDKKYGLDPSTSAGEYSEDKGETWHP